MGWTAEVVVGAVVGAAVGLGAAVVGADVVGAAVVGAVVVVGPQPMRMLAIKITTSETRKPNLI